MKIHRIFSAIVLSIAAFSSFGGEFLYSETADFVRFQQFTGANSDTRFVLWRMPNPGVSTFPGGSCIVLSLPGTVEKTNRFYAVYMLAQSLSTMYFVHYNTVTCEIISYGMD